MKEKYIRTFGNSYICNSPNNKKLMDIFVSQCKSHGVMYSPEEIFAYENEFDVSDGQMSIFDTAD